jgi:integrase
MNKYMLAEYEDAETKRLLSLPFADAISYWVSLNDMSQMSDCTRTDRAYRLSINEKVLQRCPAEIHQKKIPEITQRDLNKMYAILKEADCFKQSATTRKKWHQFISSIYRNLFEAGVITKLPTAGWKSEIGKSIPMEMVDAPILSKLVTLEVSSFMDSVNLSFLLMALETGVRLSSLVKFDLCDLKTGVTSSGEKVIIEAEVIAAKYGSNYRAPISYHTSKILMDYIENYRPKSATTNNLFVTKDGKPLTKRNAAKRLSTLCEKAGIPPISPHQLRVTFATYLASKTKDTKVIMDALGVNSEGVAWHYIRESEKYFGRDFVRANSVVDYYAKLTSGNNEENPAQMKTDATSEGKEPATNNIPTSPSAQPAINSDVAQDTVAQQMAYQLMNQFSSQMAGQAIPQMMPQMFNQVMAQLMAQIGQALPQMIMAAMMNQTFGQMMFQPMGQGLPPMVSQPMGQLPLQQPFPQMPPMNQQALLQMVSMMMNQSANQMVPPATVQNAAIS